MPEERIEGKERKEYGKAEEKIGKEFDDENRKMAGKAEKVRQGLGKGREGEAGMLGRK
jgi:uncharacterized protein YjbJ (UPF0337 family)